MDISSQEGFYHIRTHVPETFDASYSKIIEDLCPLFVITREGGHYCKVKHRHIRPHLHTYCQWEGSHTALRSTLRTSCPTLRGNGVYSIKQVRSPNILSYILKGNKVVASSLPQEYLDTIPEWKDPKEYFRTQIYNHILERKQQHELNPKYPHPYGANHAYHDIARYCKEKDRWLRKNEYHQLAFSLGIITTIEYIYTIL